MSRPELHTPPPRDGVGASSVVLPSQPAAPWTSVLDFLAQRFPGVSRVAWRQRLEQGDVLDSTGQAIAVDAPFVAGARLFYYRAVESEAPIPFVETVLWQDEHLLVADKPHFLPVTPSGKYVRETLLVRLKDRLQLPDLSPIHRIDRDTAGLVLFSVNPATRNAYQRLFRQREVHKVYECLAPWNPALSWPLRRETRIGDARHFMQQTEEDGPVNAITTISVLETHGTWARFRLEPLTGKRHQLRVHMNALNLPILNDGIYPVLTPENTDYRKPLQLLAKELSFPDPITGQQRMFRSQRQLLGLPLLSNAQ